MLSMQIHGRVLSPRRVSSAPVANASSWRLTSLVALLLLLCPGIAIGQLPTDIGAAVAKYDLGQTRDAIDDLERLFTSLNYESDKVSFIRAARILLDLYWRVEDPTGIRRVLIRVEDVLVHRQPLDDLDRFLATHQQSYRVRELLLYGDRSAARQLGLKLLDILQANAPLYGAARLELLLTLAMISRAEFRLSEAESYMHQAIGVALQDGQLYGLAALELLDSLLRHYMESAQYQYAALIVDRLRKAPAAFNTISYQSIGGFSFGLQFAELLLQTLPIDSSEPLLQFLLDFERVQGSIQGLPLKLKLQLYAILLYLRLQRNEMDTAQDAFSKLEAFYRTHASDAKGVANFLAWAAYRLGAHDTAARYVEAGRSDADELNVYLYPLNRLVAATLDRDAGRLADAARNAQGSFWALLKNIAVRGFAAPTAAINLSFAERAIVIEFVRLALDLSSSNTGVPAFKEQLSLAVQLLQRDRLPRGALFAPGLRVAPTANLEEHLRAREHLSQARYRVALSAIDLLVDRAAMTAGGAPPKVYDFGESHRFFEYGLRVNALDTYLQSLLYSQVDFLATRLALVPPQDLQRVIASNEALVSHVAIAPDRLVIECLTRDTVEFFSTQFDVNAFLSDVRLLNLSVSATHQPSRTLDRQYPAASALAIFQTLFAPAATCLSGKTRLIIATDAALLGVPFNALLTAMPATSGDGYDLRHAPWMIRTWALSVSLARSTLLYQRVRPTVARPRKPFVGIGNPRFDGAPNIARVGDPRSVYTARGTARIEAIRGLPALPDTEEELRAIASFLGERDSALLLDEDATERNVRSQDLEEYRVIAFATHGLTAGDFDSLAEPALVLTPGDPQDTRTDGLLTMSEISRLWLSADLVVLSACNTAAGDGTPSSFGFSGLVNAFFFAGARAVLASQWPVFSQMAEALTTGMFAAMASEPPSVALQRAMLRIIEESPEPEYAHPRFWAPFLVAGDGAPTSGFVADSRLTSTRLPLSTQWERNLGEKLAGEILAVAAAADGGVYAMGYTEPKNDRVKSIVLALDSQGTERWRVEDPVIGSAAQLLLYGENRIAAAGSLWSKEQFQGVILRDFNAETGVELWRTVIDTPEHDRTLGLLSAPGNHLLWVIGSYPDKTDAKAPRLTITLVTIDASGAEVARRSQSLIGEGLDFFSGRAVTRWQGHVLLALSTSKSIYGKEMFRKESRDLASGYSTACATKHFTRLILLEESTGRIVTDKTIDGMLLRSFVIAPDGGLLAATKVWDTCLGSSDAAVAEVAADLSIKTIFRYGGPLEKAAWDITVLPDGRLALVGSVTLLFDLDPYVKRENPLDAKWFWPGFTGELFQSDRKTSSAFVVVLDRDGNFLADRVIRDLRGRSIRAAAARNDGSLLFGGLANGVSNWLGIINTK